MTADDSAGRAAVSFVRYHDIPPNELASAIGAEPLDIHYCTVMIGQHFTEFLEIRHGKETTDKKGPPGQLGSTV
jgi:hypothetical protein